MSSWSSESVLPCLLRTKVWLFYFSFANLFFFIPDYPDMTLAPILNYNTICKAEISVCFLFDTKILMITGTPLGELTLVCHTGPGKKILTLAEPTRTIKQEWGVYLLAKCRTAIIDKIMLEISFVSSGCRSRNIAVIKFETCHDKFFKLPSIVDSKLYTGIMRKCVLRSTKGSEYLILYLMLYISITRPLLMLLFKTSTILYTLLQWYPESIFVL